MGAFNTGERDYKRVEKDGKPKRSKKKRKHTPNQNKRQEGKHTHETRNGQEPTHTEKRYKKGDKQTRRLGDPKGKTTEVNPNPNIPTKEYHVVY